MAGQPTAPDPGLLRQALTVAQDAKDHGRHPFGALVADSLGQVVSSAGNNSIPPEGDPTQHAELRALAEASLRLDPEAMARATLYTSAEPCVMCTGAAYWTGIGTIVYALSEHRLLELTGANPENPTFDLPCREVISRGQRHIEVFGPLLEEEAAVPHIGFWN